MFGSQNLVNRSPLVNVNQAQNLVDGEIRKVVGLAVRPIQELKYLLGEAELFIGTIDAVALPNCRRTGSSELLVAAVEEAHGWLLAWLYRSMDCQNVTV
ncbi:hypothetical protein D9M69_419840 [compost metagenome]